jgi:hypothetical protein
MPSITRHSAIDEPKFPARKLLEMHSSNKNVNMTKVQHFALLGGDYFPLSWESC